MDRVFKITRKGNGRSHVGIPVCTGPGTVRLMVTWPYRDEGRIIEIPRDEVDTVEEAREGRLRDKPRILDEAS